MALPEPFSDIEHLQLVVRRELNRDIREHFRDLHDENGNWEPEIATTRGQMLRALLHEDSDPIQVTVARMMLYYFTYNKQQETPSIIQMEDRLYEDFNYRPEIKLSFYQSRRDTQEGDPPSTGEITYKLMDETSNTITPAKVRTLAERIKTLFTEPGLFVWHKGKHKYTYLDIPNGYDFRLLAINENEAKRIVEQVLDIERKTPDWNNLALHESKRSHNNASQTKYIYGKNRKVPRWRPTVDVKFRYASIKIHGIPRPISIVDSRNGVTAIPIVA